MTEQENQPIEQTPIKKKDNKPPLRMVPLFSRRSLLILGIGLVVGIALALGYWIISPYIGSSSSTSSSESSMGTGLVHLLGIEPSGPYYSKVSVQIVNPGSDYKSLGTLQQMGEYYAAKASSLPFFQFLSRELAKYPLEHVNTFDELNQNITATYDYKSELPSIKITVTAQTEKDTAMLVELLPQAFRNYLISEEKDKRQKEYDNTVSEISSVKTALYQAQQELDQISPDQILEQNPDYLSLKAKAEALQQLLNTQAGELILNMNEKDVQAEYDDAVGQMVSITAKLNAAQQEVQKIQASTPVISSTSDNVTIIMLDAKIKALQSQLDKLMTGDLTAPGLAELIANSDTGSTEYVGILKKVQTTSNALAIAKQELQNITGGQENSALVPMNPEYEIAQIKVDSLKAQQAALKNKITQLLPQLLSSTGNNTQQDPRLIFDNTALALIEAKEQLNSLVSKLGYDSTTLTLDMKVAQDKVNTLNDRLENLTQQLGLLVGDNGGISTNEYLVSGSPTIPSPILPERSRARNTILLGAILGIVIFWLILNFKWVISLVPGREETGKNMKNKLPSGKDKDQD